MDKRGRAGKPGRAGGPEDKPRYAPKDGGTKPAPHGDKPKYAPKGDGARPAPHGDKPKYAPKGGGMKPAPHGEKPKYAPKDGGRRPAPHDGRPRDDRPRGDRPPRGERRAPRQANLAPRRVALETLLDVARSDAYASLALDKRLSQAGFGPRDRAFCTRLVYGTLENRITLDWRIDQFLNEDKELEPTVREILRMGAYQLFYLDRVPDMAAVDESVGLTRAMGLEPMTGLVNAVLRAAIRGKDAVVYPKPEDDPAFYLCVMFSVPRALSEMLIEAYGERGALELLRYRPRERPTAIRVNGLRCDDARLRRLLADDGFEFSPGLLPGTYRVQCAGDLTRLRAFQNGLFTIQGESSVLAARLVGARPGQTVLDACAAPGGKTAVLSEMMSDTGRVYAWDTHAHRVELIRGTANRLKLENVRPMLRDARVPRPDMAMTLDAALVDAPCSGTGVLLEKPDLKYRVTREGVAELAGTQAAILDAVAPMVKPGGALVYSTCSVLPAENEEQARAFLARHPEYAAERLGDELPEALRAHEGELGIQMLPHRDGTDGFYVARFRRGNA